MEQKLNYKKIFLRLIFFIIPISLLIYDYTASKLYSNQQSSIATIVTIVIIFLFFYSLYIAGQNRRVFQYRETKYLVLFFIVSLPSYFISQFPSLESYVRYFSLISFVPLAFISGLYWAIHFNSIENAEKGKFLNILLIPAILTSFMIINSDILTRFSGDEVVRDYVFGVILFLPLLLYYNKVLWPIVFLTIAVYICIISSKRSGILCVVSVVPFLFLVRADLKKGRIYRLITLITIALLASIIAFNYLPDITPQLENVVERFNNMDDESNEIRMLKYTYALKEIEQSNLFTILFGHGCYASVQYMGSPVHNDWIEIAFDYGLLPLIFIIALFISLLVRVMKNMKVVFSYSIILLSTLIIFLITTNGNCMFTTPIDVFVLMFMFGFALSNLTIHNKATFKSIKLKDKHE